MQQYDGFDFGCKKNTKPGKTSNYIPSEMIFDWCGQCNKQILNNSCEHCDRHYHNSKRNLKHQEYKYLCDECGCVVDKNCGHKNYGDFKYLMDFTLEYFFCKECKQIICNNDCGHNVFGRVIYARNVDTSLYYYCYECAEIINYECGHGYFGDKGWIRDIDPDKLYICDCFGKHIKCPGPDECCCECVGKKSNEVLEYTKLLIENRELKKKLQEQQTLDNERWNDDRWNDEC